MAGDWRACASSSRLILLARTSGRVSNSATLSQVRLRSTSTIVEAMTAIGHAWVETQPAQIGSAR